LYFYLSTFLTPVLLLVIEYYFSNYLYLYLSTNLQYSFHLWIFVTDLLLT